MGLLQAFQLSRQTGHMRNRTIPRGLALGCPCAGIGTPTEQVGDQHVGLEHSVVGEDDVERRPTAGTAAF